MTALRSTKELPEPQSTSTAILSASKPTPKPEAKRQPSSARLPPPALFQGPPSRNASNISLHIPGANAAAIGLPAATHVPPVTPQSDSPLSRVSSRIRPGTVDLNPSKPNRKDAGAPPNIERAPSTFSRQTTDANAKHENDRADALWVEMQNTLAEVEVSAANGSHIFGADHARALEELRVAQLELAQAWATSEMDEVESHDVETEAGKDEEAGVGGSVDGGVKEKNSSGKGDGNAASWPGPGPAGSKESEKERKKTLEEETENDILTAKARRAANDRYFDQVNHAVVEVVKKLDVVAGAMKRVEKESRDIWSDEEEDNDGDDNDDDDDDATESVTASTSGG